MVGEAIINDVRDYECDELNRTFKAKCLDGTVCVYHNVAGISILEEPCKECFTVKILYDLMKKTTKDIIKEIAKEVVEGKWGYGAERKHRLEEYVLL